MEFIIVVAGACLIFGVCFAVFYFKSTRSKEPGRLHMCASGDDCQCEKKHPGAKPFDLIETLEKAKRQGPQS